MENLMAVKELEKGRDFANQLRGLIFQHDYDNDDKAKVVVSAEDLVAKVLDSFTNTLSLFNHNNVSADSSISSSSFSHHFPSNSDESQSHDEIPKSKNRTSPTSSSIKDPSRSSPKKRKSTVQTWVEDSKMSPKDDGCAWRKYGQKIILNTKHLRHYFRCTHKYDLGCEATKQVQKIQENPPLYRTTYFGHHTCTNVLNPLIDESPEYLNSPSSYILSFSKNKNNSNNLIATVDPKVNNSNNNITSSFLIQQNHYNHFLLSGSLFPSSGSIKKEEQFHNIKQEKKKNYSENDKIINVVVPSCASKDCLVSSPCDQEAVLPPFGSGDDNQVDMFNSLIFNDDPLVFEDLLLEII